LVFGAGGLRIGFWPQTPIPNPQSPIPIFINNKNKIIYKYNLILLKMNKN